MKGKYYGVYDLKNDEMCVGVFESVSEICEFFGGITKSRVWCAVTRKNPLAFKSKRYWVEVFTEPSERAIRAALRERFGKKNYRITEDGVFFRVEGVKGWQKLEGEICNKNYDF